MVEVVLDSGATSVVMSSVFTRKQEFRLKKIERPIYIRNVDNKFNKKRPIEHAIEVNIFYKRHKNRMELNVIGEQK